MGEVILCPREQCLDRGKETRSYRAGAAGVVAAAGSTSRVFRRRRITSIIGKNAGPTHGSTAQLNERSPLCSPKNGHLYCRCQSVIRQ
jgi:hypothetical protein